MNILKTTRLFAATLVVAGAALIAPLAYFTLRTNQAVAANKPTVVQQVLPPQKPTLITGTPVKLSIPSLKMDLQVIPGLYNKQTHDWTLTLDKAQFATISTPPNNETGNTLIYGHYRPEVFAYLHLIKSGAKAYVTTDNGYKFTYTYKNSEALDPADTSIFLYKGVPRLTIQTCSGSFFQHRQMYYFHYDGVKKA